MDIKELIKAGRLNEARQQAIEGLKARPADQGQRTLLAQILFYLGEWDKAELHLDTLAAQNVKAEAGVQVYKNLIAAEKERLEVVARKRRPSFLPETPPYTEKYFLALEKITAGALSEAQELFAQIDRERPSISGTMNGKPFTGFKDTDTFLSLFLEAMVHERYAWIPFESIRELVLEPPKTFLDLLWATARITTWEGLTLNCFLPALYPRSYIAEDDRLKLGRMTDWIPLGGPFARGIGQHVYEIGSDDVAILELREVLFTLPSAGEEP